MSDIQVDVIVAVPATTAAEALAGANRFIVPDGLAADLVVLDVSIDGSVIAPKGARRVRGATFSVGAALQALAADAGETPIVLRRSDAAYDPAQLSQVLAAFAENADADIITTNVGIAVGGGVHHVIDPAQDGGRPPQCWDAGLALRPRVAASLSDAAWFPVLLSFYIKAFEAGLTCNIEVALASVGQDTFASERFAHFSDLHLVHSHREPFGMDAPWMSIVVPVTKTLSDAAEALSALYRQVLPPGTFEVLTVDRGDGQLADGLDALSFNQPGRTLRMPGATLGAALQAGVEAAVGQVVLFVDEDGVAFPDLAEHHIRAHRDRPGQLIVAVGSQELPLEDLADPVSRALVGEQPTAWVLVEDGLPIGPARRFDVGNGSALRDAIIAAGGFDTAFDLCAGEELGWRMEAQGYEALAVANARLRLMGRTEVDGWLQTIENQARERVGVHTSSPVAMDASGLHDVTTASLNELLEANEVSAGPVRAALVGLSEGPQLYSLEALGGEWAELASDLEVRSGKLLTHLRRLAEARGRLAGLTAGEFDSYLSILRSQKLPLPGARSTRFLLRPIQDDELGWLGVLARFLVGFGPADDATLIVFADPASGGPTSEEVRTAVLELTRRIEPGANGGWADVQVAEASGTPGELVRLVGTVDGWTPTGRDEDAVVEAISTVVGTPGIDTSDWLMRGTGGVEPWPVATRARFKLFVWPDWSSEDELRDVFDVFARPLANREDAALVLRYDIDADGDPEENLRRMAKAYEDTLGEGYGLDVVLLDDPAETADFGERLGASMQAVGVLPSSASGLRKALYDQLTAPAVHDLMSVTTQLFSMPPMPLGPLYVPTLSLF